MAKSTAKAKTSRQKNEPLNDEADDPILSDPPTIEVEGRTYTVRRLGLRDVFQVARVLGNGVAVLTDASSGGYTPGQTAQVLVASLTRNEGPALELIASVLGVSREELEDPDQFPLDSIVDVLETLAQHQDMRAFLGKVNALMQRLPEMQTASQKPSES